MKYIFLVALAFTITTATTSGCNEIKTHENGTETGQNSKSNLIPIKKGITFTVKEAYDPGPVFNTPVKPFIQLEMQTGDIFPCLGYAIVSELNRKKSNIQINIHGVEKPHGACLSALGPAMYSFPLNLKPGRYDLNFHYNNEHNAFHLIVTDSSLKISGKNSSFATSKTNVFWRYPKKSFAYACLPTTKRDTRWKCEEFEKMLNDSLDITPFTFPNYGTIPYPTTKVFEMVTYYHYPNEKVFGKAGNMLSAYADTAVNAKGDTYLKVINWKDKVYWSSDNRK
jgi:hypothetical protein